MYQIGDFPHQPPLDPYKLGYGKIEQHPDNKIIELLTKILQELEKMNKGKV